MEVTLNQKDPDGPYKATVLWGEAVRGFREGMPTQRHWRQFRFHDNCFTAAAAVSWLRQFLAGSALFSPHVSREQTTRLLNKFVKAGIIVDVRARKSDADVFKDNSDLYRLSEFGTPGRSALTLIGGSTDASSSCGGGGGGGGARCRQSWSTSSPPQQQQQQQQQQVGSVTSEGSPRLRRRVGAAVRHKRRCPSEPAGGGGSVVSLGSPPELRPMIRRRMSAAEVQLVWRDVLLARLSQLMQRPASALISSADIVPGWIEHNTVRVNQRGLVLLPAIDSCAANVEADDPLAVCLSSFPNWVLLAMKCLANWPLFAVAPASLGQYDGFENDVLRVIVEHLQRRSFPLVPYELYEPLVAALTHAAALDARLKQQQQQQQMAGRLVAACQLPSAISLLPAAGAPVRRQVSDGALLATPAKQTRPAGVGASVENLLLLMSPQTSTPLTTSDNVATERQNKVAGAGGGENSLFASPAVVTPASASVARLKERLQRLGVGVSVSSSSCSVRGAVDSEEEYFQLERGRASSFLRAIAQSRESIDCATSDTATTAAAGVMARDEDAVRFCRGQYRRASVPRRYSPAVLTPGADGGGLNALCTSSGDARVCATAQALHGGGGGGRRSVSVTVPTPALDWDDESAPGGSYGQCVTLLPCRGQRASASHFVFGSGGGSPDSGVCESTGAGCTVSPNSTVSTTDSAVGSSVSSLRGVFTAPPPPPRPPQPPIRSSSVDTCLETVFGASVEPLTRRIRQSSVDALHLSPTSCRASSTSVTIEDDAAFDGVVSGGGGGFAGGFIKRCQLRDDSLTRSVKRLKQRRRDQKQRRLMKQQQQQQLQEERENIAPDDVACGGRRRCQSIAWDGRQQMSSKAARVLGVHVSELQQKTPFSVGRDNIGAGAGGIFDGGRSRPVPLATRAWQRRSVADPSRVGGDGGRLGSAFINSSSAAGRLRHSVAVRDFKSDAFVAARRTQVDGLLSTAGWLRHRPPTPPPKPRRLQACCGTGSAVECPPRKAPPVIGVLESDEARQLACDTVQLLLTLLPPSNRRQLQLLMRFMKRAAGNKQLRLGEPAVSTRQLLLEKFSTHVLSRQPSSSPQHHPAITTNTRDDCVEDPVARAVVAFIMDHQTSVLAPSNLLHDDVQQRLDSLQHAQGWSAEAAPPAVTYCQLVSAGEFERQRMSRSCEALLQLLDTIIGDDTMARKEKRRRLKQFREAYPEIYSHRLLEADTQLWSLSHRGQSPSSLSTGRGGGGGAAGSLLAAATGSLSSLVRSRSLRL